MFRRLIIGLVAVAVMSVGLVGVQAPAAQACAGSLCDVGSVAIKKHPRWTTVLKPYIYVKDHHYRNHKLSAYALRVVTQKRLDRLHAYWKKYRVPTASHRTSLSVNRSATYGGRHAYIETHWWGLKMWFDAYASHYAMATTGAAAAILTFFSLGSRGWPPAAAMAAVLGSITAIWYLCQNARTGATTFYSFGPPVPPFTVLACKPW